MVPSGEDQYGAPRSNKDRPSTGCTPTPTVVAVTTAYPIYDTPHGAAVGVTPYDFVPAEANRIQ